MFIECPKHKSKMKRSIVFCLERCKSKCDAFYDVDPKKMAAVLRDNPECGTGHQLEMFKLNEKPKRRRKK